MCEESLVFPFMISLIAAPCRVCPDLLRGSTVTGDVFALAVARSGDRKSWTACELKYLMPPSRPNLVEMQVLGREGALNFCKAVLSGYLGSVVATSLVLNVLSFFFKVVCQPRLMLESLILRSNVFGRCRRGWDKPNQAPFCGADFQAGEALGLCTHFVAPVPSPGSSGGPLCEAL